MQSNNQFTTLEVDSSNGIDRLTLNRPQRLNSITRTMAEELAAYFNNRLLDHETRVIVLRGAGKAFCAGLDLKQHSEGTDALNLSEDGWLLTEVVRLMYRCPQPIVALLHGAASGGGFALALAADIRIAAESARMNGAFIQMGLTGTEMGVSYFLPRIVGQSVARELLYTGRFLDAKRALAMGLVSTVTSEAKLTETGDSLAREMLIASPKGLRLTKRSLNAAMSTCSLDATLEVEERGQIMCLGDSTFEDRISAFLRRQRTTRAE